MSAEGTIYYIRCSETNFIKIGYTRGNPLSRMASLQTGTPSKLAIMAVHPGTMDMERKIHEKLAAHRVRGEWFDDSDEVFDHLAQVIATTIAMAKIEGREPPAWALAVVEVLYEHGLIHVDLDETIQ